MRDGMLIVTTALTTMSLISVVWLAASLRALADELERTRARRRR
jgi:uncharacterized small protein (DUF1192 family)